MICSLTAPACQWVGTIGCAWLEEIPRLERWREAINMPYLPPAPAADTQGGCRDDSLPGTYHHPGYGTISIDKVGEYCVLRYGALTFHLTQEDEQALTLMLTGNVPRVFIDWWGARQAVVQRDAHGRVAAITIPFEPAVAGILFERCDLTDNCSGSSQ